MHIWDMIDRSCLHTINDFANSTEYGLWIDNSLYCMYVYMYTHVCMCPAGWKFLNRINPAVRLHNTISDLSVVRTVRILLQVSLSGDETLIWGSESYGTVRSISSQAVLLFLALSTGSSSSED